MTSVALVVLDTLRKDAFERHFDWLPGISFDRCLATSHWTVPTHASLFTGRYASEVGTHAKSMTLKTAYQTLGDAASDHTTRFYSANPQMAYYGGWTDPYDDVMSPWEIQQPDSTHLVDWDKFAVTCDKTGVHRYLEAAKTAILNNAPTIRSLRKGHKVSIHNQTDVDDSGASAIRDRIRNTSFDDNEFLFVNLMEAHTPYDPPESYRSTDQVISPVFADRWADDPPDKSIAHQAYDDAVAYLSDVYREIFHELRTSMDYVVTVSDHGELLGDYGHWNHVHGLYPQLTHIPLVISGAEIPASNTEAVVSFLDVHQTVVELLDVVDRTDGRGRSLLSPVEPKPQYTEFHGLPQWIKPQLEQYGVSEKYGKYDEPLYGVRTADGAYGYQSTQGIQGSLSNDDLREHIDTFTLTVPTTFDEASGEIDAAIRERLEDLGYA